MRLTPEPGGDRTQEVIVAQQILQALELRSFTPTVIACPGCGRTASTFFQQLAEEIQQHIRRQMPSWRHRYPGVEKMSVAVMGCVVNGPGRKDGDAEGREHRPGVPAAGGRLRTAALRPLNPRLRRPSLSRAPVIPPEVLRNRLATECPGLTRSFMPY